MSAGTPGRSVRPPDYLWVASVHDSAWGGRLLGSGFAVDDRRVLTCAHVVCDPTEVEPRPELWVEFPHAWEELGGRRLRVVRTAVPPPERRAVQDVAVLELDAVLEASLQARVRRPAGRGLVDGDWWAFGFPDGNELGNSADGRVGEELAHGWVRLDTGSRYPVRPGFSGAAVWSPRYEAVVGIIGQAQGTTGDARALTLRAIDSLLPAEKLHVLCERGAAQAAGEQALAAWGWRLDDDPEAGPHWRPRARGVSSEAERGYRFRGRTAALTQIVEWISDPLHVERRVLVVTGSPGVGKSAVLGRVVTTADAAIAAALPEDDQAVRAPVGSVSCAVHAKGKTALDVAREIARVASAVIPDEPRHLAAGIREVLQDGRRGPFVVVLDALDEAASPEDARAIVRHVVLPLVESCSDLGVRMVVGTRRVDDAGALLTAFGPACKVVDLDGAEYFAQEDLVAYTLATLQLRGDERPGNPYDDPVAAQPVAGRIAAMADQNFLVAGLIARSHGMHDQRPLHPREISFTPTVESALQEYLQRLPRVGAERLSAAEVLTALAYAEAPGMTGDLWIEAVAALHGRAPTTQELDRFARSSAANFLIESSGSAPRTTAFRLFHQALNDALIAGRVVEDDQRALARAFQRLGCEDWSRAPEYLLRALPRHAVMGGCFDELLTDDRYLLHADLRRLIPASSTAAGEAARARARLLRKTPEALDAGPDVRTALFSVVEAQEQLGTAYRSLPLRTPYRARWATTSSSHEVSVLTSHSGWVRAVCEVPAGGRMLLASGGDDGVVRLWDLDTGEQLSTLRGSTAGWVRALCAVEWGGRMLLAVGGDDTQVRLWDPETGDRIRALETGRVRTLCAVAVDGRTLLATGADDGFVRLWDVQTGEPLLTRKAHEGWVNALCPVPGEGRSLLASGGDDGRLVLWDPEDGRRLRFWEAHPGGVHAVAVTRSGPTQLITGGYDGVVRLWDPETGECLRTMEPSNSQVSPVHAVCAVCVDGRAVVASAGEDGSVRLWDAASGYRSRILSGHLGSVYGMCAVGADTGLLLVSAGTDGTVRMWDPHADAEGAAEREQPSAASLCVVTSGGRELVVSAERNGDTCFWEAEAGRPVPGPDHVPPGPFGAMTSVTSAGRSVVMTLSHDGFVQGWSPDPDVQPGLGPGYFQLDLGYRAEDGTEQSVASGQVLAAVACRGEILLAYLGTDGAVRVLEPRRAGVARRPRGRIAWRMGSSESQRMLCAWVEDEVLCVAVAREWGVEGVRRGDERSGGGPGLWGRFAPDEDETVPSWHPDRRSGNAPAVRFTALCTVESRGRTLLVGGAEDSRLRVWDPRTAELMGTIAVRYPVRALSSAGDRLYVGFDTGVLALTLDLG